MANEAATAWISPTFIQRFDSGPVVVVLNPNESTTTATVGFYWNTGGLKATVKKAIGPRNSERFALDEISSFPYFEGWVYVDCDQPVLPAGYTKGPVPLQWSNQHEAHYPMTFYQAGGIEPPEYIEIQDLPPAKAVHDLR